MNRHQRSRASWLAPIYLGACFGVAIGHAAEPVTPTDNRPASPTNSSAGKTRADIQFEAGLKLAAENRIDGAIAVFSQLSRDYPQLREPHEQIAALYLKQGNVPKAADALQSALRLQADDPILQEQLGDLYLFLASRAYKAALETQHPSASAKNKFTTLESINPLQEQKSD